MSNLVHIRCNCCGYFAGYYQQWHQYDSGFGICQPCLSKTVYDETTNSIYGKAAVHRPYHRTEALSAIRVELKKGLEISPEYFDDLSSTGDLGDLASEYNVEYHDVLKVLNELEQ